MIITRLAVTLGLSALAYYLGREVGRTHPIREALQERRERLAKEGKGEIQPHRETREKD